VNLVQAIVTKPEHKIPLRKPMGRWKKNIKNLSYGKMIRVCELHPSRLGELPVKNPGV
jgi:hypothetical protein